MMVKKCEDCEKDISLTALRCKSCSNRNREITTTNWKGLKRSKESKLKISKAKLGSKNPAWKGDNVGYKQLHFWIRKHKPKLNHCEMCKRKGLELDLANISRKYKRDINDFWWLCKKCHAKFDGRNKSAFLEG